MNVSSTAEIITNNEHKPTKPEFAIVFYSTPANGIFTTRHTFKGDIMQAGKIINQDEVFDCVASLKEQSEQTANSKKSTTGFLPANVLLDDAETLIWYSEARHCDMWFRIGAPLALKVEWPALLFVLHKPTSRENHPSLRILALDSNERPTLDSVAYWSPLSNVYQSHKLCQGSASLPKNCCIETIGEIEATLYDSAFAGFKHSMIFKQTDLMRDGLKFWQNKAKTKTSVYAKQELYPFCTIAQLVENRTDSDFYSAASHVKV